MLRWTTLGLAFLVLCLVVSPVSAQKVLCDQTSYIGFNIYAHNWQATMNNLDNSNPGGGYVYLFSNASLFGGPPIFLDSVHTCWDTETTRGASNGRMTGNGVAISEFSILICNIASGGLAAGPIAGTSTIAGWAESVANSDLCMAPYNANPVFLTGGFFVPTTFFGFGPGCWLVARIFGTPVTVTTSLTNNAGWLGGTVVYEIQHGYNGTPTNQMYLGIVSVNEATYPYAGGALVNGRANYGAADGWPAGLLASSSRVISFSTGYVLTMPGQSAEGNCDGLDLENSIAWEEGTTLAGKKNASCVDGNGAFYYDYGDGGGNWTATTFPVNCDLFNVKCLNYYYGQLNNAGSACPDPNGNTYEAYVLRSRTRHGAANPLDPVVGSFMSVVPDAKTTLMLTNPKAVANVNCGKKFAASGLVGDLGSFLLFDGAWPAFGDMVDGAGDGTLILGSSNFPRGDNFVGGSNNGDLLDLCNPKAPPAGLKTGRDWYVGHLVLRSDGVYVDDSHLDTIFIN